jgi:hypothetical protein
MFTNEQDVFFVKRQQLRRQQKHRLVVDLLVTVKAPAKTRQLAERQQQCKTTL